MTRPSDTRDLLVIGHPRSGTGYMSRLLQAYGLPVGHEVMESGGISSWMFAAVTDDVPYSFDESSRSRFSFKYVVHVVRHPLKVISSMLFTVLPDEKVSDYMRRFVVLSSSENEIERVCRGYLGWNKLIDAQRPDLRVRVEEAPFVLHRFLREAGFDVPSAPLALPPPDYNSRPHRMLDADDVRSAIPSELWNELIEYTVRLGYRGDFS